jgi:murein DD-endopeptidase MepM/ murein hydrolase activator NlpD
MRKIIFSLAALAALSFALPYAAPAKADEIVVHRHHHHHWHHHNTVIIKHDHHD